MENKIELVGYFSFKPIDSRLEMRGIPGTDFGSSSPIIAFNKKIAEHFVPDLPVGAKWVDGIWKLGKLKITVERVQDDN